MVQFGPCGSDASGPLECVLRGEDWCAVCGGGSRSRRATKAIERQPPQREGAYASRNGCVGKAVAPRSLGVISLSLYISLSLSLPIYIYICIYICVCIYIYIYMYIYIYIYIYLYNVPHDLPKSFKPARNKAIE